MEIAEISSEITKNESVKERQRAKKEITQFFTYVNEQNPTMGAIAGKYNFADIQLRGRLRERDTGR